ncbi:hypothetical protein F5X68DRAFT_200658 [Plectosphaerella plurivora]|uniref:Uncharacterized protein n=1 Tax=Plectosphaerella plurivora TaxID=936078 RepID=A0A9P8VHL8_9PEZI|nr:hypothetical protein F5X68DRAFT_200658 [Plectosphaerella plurivora]
MATNSGRGNPIGAMEGKDTIETSPPPVSAETKAEVARSASSVHTAGQDAGMANNDPAGPAPPTGADKSTGTSGKTS